MSNFAIKEPSICTLVILTFNQEDFVQEAIEGALSQSYSPLEILISDDHSTDATFSIAEKLAENYRGPHKIRLNRNESNLGIGRHVSRIFEIASGDLILLAAGDDVSEPTRVEKNCAAWLKTGRRANCIYSGYTLVDEQGKDYHSDILKYGYGQDGSVCEKLIDLNQYFNGAKPKVWGCATAYSRRIAEVFGSLPDVVQEDDILVFRASCLGPLLEINLPLVRYRIHNSNVLCRKTEEIAQLCDVDREEQQRRREWSIRSTTFRALLRDIEAAGQAQLIQPIVREKLLDDCKRQLRIAEKMVEFQDADWTSKPGLFISLTFLGLKRSQLRLLILRMLPKKLFRQLQLIKHRLRNYIS
jgi:glycosyltransferase involved in cell wall biosynthesis